MQEEVLRLCELVKQNRLIEAASALSSLDVNEVICSSELTSPLISIEQNACRLLKDCFENEENSPEFIQQTGLFNYRLAIL